jgi:pimeloyl-ACP methyl ester carboxylesterase
MGDPMPDLALSSSALAGERPVRIHYSREGHGAALVFLHGGWGYDIYPLDAGPLIRDHLVVVPRRAGYGRSTPLEAFPPEFHRCALLETVAVLDGLGIDRAVWWGHSDGAVIAAMAAIHTPGRVRAVILEALHFYAAKPRSRAFFERMAADPDSFGARVRQTLATEHGDDRWRTVLRLDGQAWLDLASEASTPQADLYRGTLGEVRAPVLVIHGGADPRTEPGELDQILTALTDSVLSFHAEAGHSPHSEASTTDAVTRAVTAFLGSLAP